MPLITTPMPQNTVGQMGQGSPPRLVPVGQGPNHPQAAVYQHVRYKVRLKLGAGFGFLPQVGVAVRSFHELGGCDCRRLFEMTDLI